MFSHIFGAKQGCGSFIDSGISVLIDPVVRRQLNRERYFDKLKML